MQPVGCVWHVGTFVKLPSVHTLGTDHDLLLDDPLSTRLVIPTDARVDVHDTGKTRLLPTRNPKSGVRVP